MPQDEPMPFDRYPDTFGSLLATARRQRGAGQSILFAGGVGGGTG